LPLRS